MNYWRAIAGLNGFIAIVMGAVAAHAVKDPHLANVAGEASLYQLIHAMLLSFLADKDGRWLRYSRVMVVVGIVLFCGSLYGKALFGWSSLLAPAGGVSLMIGWLLVMVDGIASLKSIKDPSPRGRGD